MGKERHHHKPKRKEQPKPTPPPDGVQLPPRGFAEVMRTITPRSIEQRFVRAKPYRRRTHPK